MEVEQHGGVAGAEAEEHRPPSPAKSPQLRDCLEPLLKFTLTCSVDGSLDTGGLSKPYCSALLQPQDPAVSNSDSFEGVPSHPLYLRLSSALFQSICSGVLLRVDDQMSAFLEESILNEKEHEWNKLIKEKGVGLLEILKTVDFELHVQEPFFSQLKDGQKTIEGRCAVGDYSRIGPGAVILFNKCLLLQVQEVRWYASFFELLEAEGLTKVLPGVESIEEGVNIYRKFYSEEKEKLNGVLAICVAKAASQLYSPLASVLSGLSYEGIQRLLGLRHSFGTIPEALPPPRSALVTSFLQLHNPKV